MAIDVTEALDHLHSEMRVLHGDRGQCKARALAAPCSTPCHRRTAGQQHLQGSSSSSGRTCSTVPAAVLQDYSCCGTRAHTGSLPTRLCPNTAPPTAANPACSNVLLTGSLRAGVGDLGVAQTVGSRARTAGGFCCTHAGKPRRRALASPHGCGVWHGLLAAGGRRQSVGLHGLPPFNCCLNWICPIPTAAAPPEQLTGPAAAAVPPAFLPKLHL